MRVLSSPLDKIRELISGESGAVGIGAFITLYENQNNYKDLWQKLNINTESSILCISTEGDTDKDGYRNVVWIYGHYRKYLKRKNYVNKRKKKRKVVRSLTKAIQAKSYSGRRKGVAEYLEKFI